jgi:hypothetical protein
MNLSLVVGLCLVGSGALNWSVLLLVFLLKYSVDYMLLYKANTYLRKGKFFVPVASSLIYPLFSAGVGLYSLFGNFSWKGRLFSN